MSLPPITVRKAAPNDIAAIYQLLEAHAQNGIVLKRSPEDIAFYLKNFTVAEADINHVGRIVGCCALRDFGNELFEVRSLVVADDFQGKGVGQRMVRSLLEHSCREHPGCRIFALTYQVDFFKKLGFEVVLVDLFPEKIWSDCDKCPKRDCCDEIAVLFQCQ